MDSINQIRHFKTSKYDHNLVPMAMSNAPKNLYDVGAMLRVMNFNAPYFV